MMVRIWLIVLVAACSAPSSTAFEMHSAKGQLLRGSVQAESTLAMNASDLKALGDSCSCSFSGLCSCVQALEFMKCIQTACDSKACDCQVHHFNYACHTMSAECPSAGLKCGSKEATCKEIPPIVTESTLELVEEIEEMQDNRCKLDKAIAAGMINAPLRSAELDPRIQDRIETLERRGVRVPKLGCREKDSEAFEDFKSSLAAQNEKEEAEYKALALKQHKGSQRGKEEHKKHKEHKEVKAHTEKKVHRDHKEIKEEEIEEATAEKKESSATSGEKDQAETDVFRGVATQTAETNKEFYGYLHSWRTLSWVHYFLIVLVNLLIAFLAAFIYDRVRLKANLPFAPAWVEVVPRGDDFGVGFFTCFTDMRLCVFAFCCPCLRWADTVDRARLLNYWIAFTIFTVLAVLSPYTFGITGLLLLFVCFRYRQLMRKRYDVAPNNCQDFLAYCFCSTCAVVQEAKVQAFRNLPPR
jgi:Cys-rich protein (TIGR01571 family)